MLLIVDRKSRYVKLGKLSRRTAALTLKKTVIASLVDDVITIGNLTSTGDELGSKLLLENRKEVEKL